MSTQVDLSKPHIARVVDYWLGGSHHYSVDREAAKRAEKKLPELPEFQRAHRAFLKRAYAYLVLAESARLDKFVDFGSGLPTQGNVHEVALEFDPDARVIYSDIDPEVVRYGREIVQATHPDQVRYVFCDGAHPEEILESELIRRLFNGDRRVGIGFTNLGHLISDDDIARALETLYQWVAPGSHLVVSFVVPDVDGYRRFHKLRQWTGQAERWYRTEADMLDLLGPWELTDHGMTYSSSWPTNRVPSELMMLNHRAFVARKVESLSDD